ncbi:hypothetical protein KR044_001440, partial [Drosophila immigrans]
LIRFVQNFSDAETQAAVKFIKENDLPMTELYYALKYVRISNRDLQSDEKFEDIQQRLNKLREEDRAMVSPPPPDWSGED